MVTEVAPTQSTPTLNVPQVPLVQPTTVDVLGGLEEKDIPSYNPTIECGYFKEVVDAVCNGTTIPRQFMHNVIKTFVGALVSEHLKFDNLDCNSCQYSVNIGASGTSKRTVWNRGILGISRYPHRRTRGRQQRQDIRQRQIRAQACVTLSLMLPRTRHSRGD